MEQSSNTNRKHVFWRWTLLVLAILLFGTWLFLTPEGLLGKADAVGYAVCHRISERSFHIGDRPGPMCARCSGLFLGALLGWIFQAVQGRKGKTPPWPVLILFALLALSWVLDGLNSFLMLTPKLNALYTTQNWTRLATGTGMGLAISAILRPIFIQTMFKKMKNASGLGNWKQVLLLLVLAGLMDIVLFLEIPWVVYILSILSAFSVIMLLTLIYSMVWVLLLKKENQYESIKQLFIPLIIGFMVAMIQIGLFDLVRYHWTGTWDGFSL
jgi:uncharacterized membrane protein